MSKKTVCLIPARWTLQEYQQHNCEDRSHRHVTRTQASADVRDGVAEWVQEPKRGARPIVRLIRVVALGAGLSARYGGYFRFALAAREDWAVTMLASIRMRRESPSEFSLPSLSISSFSIQGICLQK